MYNKTHYYCYKILVTIFPVGMSKYKYKRILHKNLDIKNPKTFNEKIQYLKLNDYYNDKNIELLADKFEVRKYIEKKGLSFLLNDIYGVYDNVNDLDWEQLPNSFVLKCTFGAQRNIIIEDKNKVSKKEVLKKMNYFLKTPFGYETVEFHYLKMKRRFLVEKYLETSDGSYPVDYKVFCMNGKPRIIEVCLNRKSDMKALFFDLKWNHLNIESKSLPKNIDFEILKPKKLKDMLNFSVKLSEGFRFVWVDFFEYRDNLLLSELTFTPAAGCSTTMSDYGQILIGEMLEL